MFGRSCSRPAREVGFSGSPKQRILLQPVLERVRRSGVDDLVVVLGAHELETSARGTVNCPDWKRGPGASLRCGLAALPADAAAAVVVLGDGPELDPAAIDRLIDAWRERQAPVGSPRATAAPGCIRSCSRARFGRKFRTAARGTPTPSSSPATI